VYLYTREIFGQRFQLLSCDGHAVAVFAEYPDLVLEIERLVLFQPNVWVYLGKILPKSIK
jgi:hypothetical protein